MSTKDGQSDLQMPTWVVDLILYTLKADFLKIIYECLAGENGLFNTDYRSLEVPSSKKDAKRA